MKEVKIRKSWLKSPEVLLRKVGAVFENKAFPSDVYISQEDYRTMRLELKKIAARKKFWSSRARNMSVGMALLDLGPNETLKNSIRPGYVLVDEEKIENSIKALSK